MPHISSENTTSETCALTIELSVDEMQPYLERAARQLSEDKPAKGFRPGKVTAATAASIYGEMALWETALDFVIRGTLPEAVEDKGFQFIGRPDISVIMCAPGNPVSYKATFILAPKVTLGDHTKISITKKPINIDDARVDSVLAEVQESRAAETAVSRPVKDGDHVIADVAMFLDSVPIDGGSLLNQHFIVGKQELWEGFGKQVVEMEKDEKKEFTLTIAKEHPQKNIAGKNVEFAVTVKDIFERTVPEINDAFAKSLGAFENLESLRSQLKDNLQKESENKEQERIENELLSALVDASTFTSIPKVLQEQEQQRLLGEMKQMMEMRGMRWEDYLSHTKKTEDELVAGYTDAAVRRIKNNLVLAALAEKLGAEASPEEIEREYQAYIQYNPDAAQDSEAGVRIKEHIAMMLSHRKALQSAVASAKVS